MICSKCTTPNEEDNLFCVGCGGHLVSPVAGTAELPPTLMGGSFVPPTQSYTPHQSNNQYDAPDSYPTVLGTSPQFRHPMPNFAPSNVYPGMPPARQSNAKFIWFAALAVLLLAGGGIAAFFISRQSANAEILPDHLGMFVQNREKNGTSEISKQDFANAVTAKDEILKNESLPTLEGKPNLILYSDGKDIPLNDLKLVQIDTIKDDGTLKQLNYQAVPVDGKPEMKRLRVSEGLANGKYAFALFDGFLDEGKHKFWAFQVKNAEKNDNGDLAKALTLAMKPKPSPTPPPLPAAPKQLNIPAPSVPPPSGASVIYCASNNVVLRSGASQYSAKIGSLYSGQKLYVLGYSSNYETFTTKAGKSLYANYAQVQTDSGKTGWVYRAYTR